MQVQHLQMFNVQENRASIHIFIRVNITNNESKTYHKFDFIFNYSLFIININLTKSCKNSFTSWRK